MIQSIGDTNLYLSTRAVLYKFAQYRSVQICIGDTNLYISTLEQHSTNLHSTEVYKFVHFVVCTNLHSIEVYKFA